MFHAPTPKGTSEKQIKLVLNRVNDVVQNCNFRFWSDIQSTKVEAYLHQKKAESGISAQTFNFYLKAIQQFCNWMVRERRAIDSPLSHLNGLNVRVDRRHDRRALSNEEMRWFLECTHKGKLKKGRSWILTGPQRSLLYRIAMETGLRSGEIRSLTKASFKLDLDQPKVIVKAAYSKRRKEDCIPLRKDTAKAIKKLLDDLTDEDTVFQMPRAEIVARSLIRPDLEFARKQWIEAASSEEEKIEREKSDFLKYKNKDGLYADFHALRHSFITAIGQTGVPFKTAQELARHSTPLLTSRYTHSLKADEEKAINSLPSLSPQSEDSKSFATGFAKNDAQLCKSVHLKPAETDFNGIREDGCNSLKNDDLAENNGKKLMEAAPGFEPGMTVLQTGIRIL